MKRLVPSISGFSVSPEVNQPRVQQLPSTKVPSLLTSQLSKASQEYDAQGECNTHDGISDYDSEYSDDSLDEDDEVSTSSSFANSSAPIPVPVSV
jgi:hypothetical protein